MSSPGPGGTPGTTSLLRARTRRPGQHHRASGHRKLMNVSDLVVGAGGAARMIALYDEIVMMRS
jgi:hypothetical protein